MKNSADSFKYSKLKNMQLCPVRGQCCGGGGWSDHLQVFKFNQRKAMSTYFKLIKV